MSLFVTGNQGEMGLGLILDSGKDDEPDPYTRGYVLVFSSSDVVVTSWKGMLMIQCCTVMDMASQGLSAANPKNLNMVKKLSLAMLTQECGQNLKSLTTMGSEGCQNAGKEVVNHERISTPATKSS
ncbi:hypothetical protein HID58_023288 [Brassica napus]|uniref:Uncharacterized protein n=1 Tax=Brassica napus TaxID=3708 RepID=A0ABQ8D1M5_BRANA|nr:hypothetical protein HID58_023288 [Brassica napus]